MKPLQVFIGYDDTEPIAYHTLAHSIMRRASRPVAITPIYKPQLVRMREWWRQRGVTESTDFSLTRFLAPWLSGYDRVSVFLDCDMLCLDDICKLESIALSHPHDDVFVVKHRYEPSTSHKFLGHVQTQYPCKNWSSVMVFNGHRSTVRGLNPGVVNSAEPSWLHQLKWANSVGELPRDWNHLVGEYRPSETAKLVHFTLGGPWFADYSDCEYSDAWVQEANEMMFAACPPAADKGGVGNGYIHRGAEPDQPRLP